jgi:hypothetical protein
VTEVCRELEELSRLKKRPRKQEAGGDLEDERKRTADGASRPRRWHRNRGIRVAPGKSLADTRLLARRYPA